MEIFNTWQFNLIGYYIFIVTFYQSYKLAVRNAHHDGAATVVLQLIAGISILFLMPLFPLTFPRTLSTYVWLILACIFYALVDRLNTSVRKHLEVSIYSIINQLNTVFLIIIGILIFSESPTVQKILGATLILAGNILLKLKKLDTKLSLYFWLAILSTLIFSIAISIDIGISSQFNLPFYIMFTLLIPSMFLSIGERLTLTTLKKELQTPDRKWYFITGISWGLMIFFALRSFQFGQVTTIVPLQAASILLNVLVAYIIFKETDDKLKKLLAALLVVLGVYITV